MAGPVIASKYGIVKIGKASEVELSFRYDNL